ncbi:hypothetical protein CLOM_g8639 [Closterium sp. NIES-68]|nr:hypothetical protein CLOM_g8639 [Closterium sp. NIES-68]
MAAVAARPEPPIAPIGGYPLVSMSATEQMSSPYMSPPFSSAYPSPYVSPPRAPPYLPPHEQPPPIPSPAPAVFPSPRINSPLSPHSPYSPRSARSPPTYSLSACSPATSPQLASPFLPNSIAEAARSFLSSAVLSPLGETIVASAVAGEGLGGGGAAWGGHVSAPAAAREAGASSGAARGEGRGACGGGARGWDDGGGAGGAGGAALGGRAAGGRASARRAAEEEAAVTMGPAAIFGAPLRGGAAAASAGVWGPPAQASALHAPSLQALPQQLSVGSRRYPYMHTAIYGCALCAAGVMALVFPMAFTVTLELLVAAVLVTGGLASLTAFLLQPSAPGAPLFLLLACLHTATALLLLLFPSFGALGLTLALAAWFMAKGASKLSLAHSLSSSHPPSSSPSSSLITAAAGTLSLIFGVTLALCAPFNATWLFALLLGTDLLVTGTAALFLAASASAAASGELHPLAPSRLV